MDKDGCEHVSWRMLGMRDGTNVGLQVMVHQRSPKLLGG